MHARAGRYLCLSVAATGYLQSGHITRLNTTFYRHLKQVNEVPKRTWAAEPNDNQLKQAKGTIARPHAEAPARAESLLPPRRSGADAQRGSNAQYNSENALPGVVIHIHRHQGSDAARNTTPADGRPTNERPAICHQPGPASYSLLATRYSGAHAFTSRRESTSTRQQRSSELLGTSGTS
jgi:hypothetical protein